MNLHQFRFIEAASKHDLNITAAAKALHTSQPGVSKAIIELEEELGVNIFVRHGKRLKRVTEPGQQILKSIDVILREVANLKRIGQHYSAQNSGVLSIGTTHSQARYVLPEPIAKLRKTYPKVKIALHQDSPENVATLLQTGVVDIGIATESLSDHSDLISLPCYDWQHMLIVPAQHGLANKASISLSDLVTEDLITYHPSFSGRSRIDKAFATQGLTPNIAIEAIDSDVIRTYVSAGIGMGVVAEMAVRDLPQPETQPGVLDTLRPTDLIARPLGHLMGRNVTRVAFKRGVYLRQYMYDFVSMLSDRLTKELLIKALQETHALSGADRIDL